MSDFTSNIFDHEDSKKIVKRMREAVNKMYRMSKDVATARQIKEFASERRKNILGKYMSKHWQPKISAAILEMQARNDAEFHTEFEQLVTQTGWAESILAEYAAEMVRYEAARSLMAYGREVHRSHLA